MFMYVILGPDDKIQFSMQLSLVCEATWVQHPSHLDLMNMARSFTIKVDTQGLAPGPHYTEVGAFLSRV